MALSAFTMLCNRHLGSPQKETCAHSGVTPRALPRPLVSTGLPSVSMDYLFWMIHLSGITWSSLLLSVSMLSLRLSIHPSEDWFPVLAIGSNAAATGRVRVNCFQFLGVYTQEWGCWVRGSFYV